jgi:hypothetical protein
MPISFSQPYFSDGLEGLLAGCAGAIVGATLELVASSLTQVLLSIPWRLLSTSFPTLVGDQKAQLVRVLVDVLLKQEIDTGEFMHGLPKDMPGSACFSLLKKSALIRSPPLLSEGSAHPES